MLRQAPSCSGRAFPTTCSGGGKTVYLKIFFIHALKVKLGINKVNTRVSTFLFWQGSCKPSWWITTVSCVPSDLKLVYFVKVKEWQVL